MYAMWADDLWNSNVGGVNIKLVYDVLEINLRVGNDYSQMLVRHVEQNHNRRPNNFLVASLHLVWHDLTEYD